MFTAIFVDKVFLSEKQMGSIPCVSEFEKTIWPETSAISAYFLAAPGQNQIADNSQRSIPKLCTARSPCFSTCRPKTPVQTLKAEITGSNPVCATRSERVLSESV